MVKEKITRSYLETLSFSELLSLCDDFGLDIPENFDYHILVGELLEFSQESEDFDDEMDIEISQKEENTSSELTLPVSYNTTEVKLMLRNPVWGYVYWNISEADYTAISKNPSSQLFLRVCSFSEKEQVKPDDSFNIKISLSDYEQYILLPSNASFFRVDLLFAIGVSIDIVASSNILEIPQPSQVLKEYKPGKKIKMSKPVELSGMQNLLLEQYKNHRESFS